MKKLFLLVLLSVCSVGYSQINYDAAYDGMNIQANLGLNMTNVEDVEDTGIGFTLGFKTIFYMNPNIGFHVGLDFNPVKAEEDGTDIEAKYLDIPFGMSFKYNLFPDGSVEGGFNVGLFYGLPMGDAEVGAFEVDAENLIGLNLSYNTLFMVNDGFNVGFNIFTKYSFSDIVDDVDSTYYAIGLGALFQFM